MSVTRRAFLTGAATIAVLTRPARKRLAAPRRVRAMPAQTAAVVTWEPVKGATSYVVEWRAA